jgi:hypothetical protein
VHPAPFIGFFRHITLGITDVNSDVKEIRRLRQDGVQSISGDIVEPSRQAAIRSGMKPESVDKAVLGQLDNLHSSQTLQQTGDELKRLAPDNSNAVPVVDPAPPPPTVAEPVVNPATTVESVAKPSTLASFATGALKLGTGLITNYVTTKVAVHIIEGSKFQQEQNTLNQANHVDSSREDAKRRDLEETVLGGVPGPPGLNIAFAAAARLGTDLFYDMIQGDRESKVQKFDEQNPDASPGAFDQLQKAEESFNNGQFP